MEFLIFLIGLGVLVKACNQKNSHYPMPMHREIFIDLKMHHLSYLFYDTLKT